MATKTIAPSYAAGNTPSGPYNPSAHQHPLGAITGLRFGANGRVEPVYDSEDVYANGVKIALYDAARARARFTPNTIPAVTVVQAIVDVDDSGETKQVADRFLADGKITKQEYDTIVKETPPETTGTKAVPISVIGKNVAPLTGDGIPLTQALTPSGTTLGQLINKVTYPRSRVTPQRGLTEAQIVTNLANWAVNIWEPFRRQYPTAFITNTFREGGGTSQHGTGQGGDLQIRGMANLDYYDVAVWCSKNLPYDQLLLEFTPGKNCWIHCSYFAEGYPGASVRKTKGVASTLATVNTGSNQFVVNLHRDMLVKANLRAST